MSPTCRAHSDRQEALAVSLFLWPPLTGKGTSPVELSSKEEQGPIQKVNKNKSLNLAHERRENATSPNPVQDNAECEVVRGGTRSISTDRPMSSVLLSFVAQSGR